MVKFIKIDEISEIKKLDIAKDVSYAFKVVCEFWDVSACAIVKNELPVGVALGSTIYDAKIKALDCNPVEAIGATVIFSQKIDEKTAKSLGRMNFSTIILPEIEENIKKYFEKSNSILIEFSFELKEYKNFLKEKKSEELTPSTFKVATKLKPTQEQVEDMVFAWKVLKTVKKNAILIAKDFKTRAIELGTSVKNIEMAMDNACDGSKEAIFAISKNIDDMKQLHPLIQGRINGLIEPKNFENTDSDIIKTAEKYGIAVVTTGNKEE